MQIEISVETVAEIVRKDLHLALQDCTSCGEVDLVLALGVVLKYYTSHDEHYLIDEKVKESLAKMQIDEED